MMESNIKKLAVGDGEHAFTLVEWTLSDDMRDHLIERIEALTEDLDLSVVRDDGKMVRLSDEEASAYQTELKRYAGVHGVSEHFGALYRIATRKDLIENPERCEQVTQYVPVIPHTVVEALRRDIPEVIENLRNVSDDPFSVFIISNAPIAHPFGQADDRKYERFFPDRPVQNRHPTAEAFMSALLRAAGHTIDAPMPGRAFAPVTPDLSKLDDAENGIWEEESSTQPFMVHIDGSNYDEYSSQVCLAVGTDDEHTETVFVHTDAVLEDLAELDAKNGLVGGTLRRQDVLGLDIFKHGPGANSTCLNVVEMPILFKDIDGEIRPRVNMTSGRVEIQSHKLSTHGLSNQDVQQTIEDFLTACDASRNQIRIQTRAGQVVLFSGQILHGRTGFSTDRTNPRFLLRLRGTSEKFCALIRDRNSKYSDRHPNYPGM